MPKPEQQLDSPQMAYVYRIPGCGCAVAAQVDEPKYKRAVERFTRDRMKRGFNLEHMTADEVRALPWGWPCEHMTKGAA